jgi:hypothetical protein
MIRPLTIATFLTACASGLYLYQSKHEAQVLDRTVEKTLHETAAYREQSRLLAAEWTMLNDPESLRRFSDTYLTLKTIAPSQFTSLTDLDSRLPAVPLPAPKGDADAEPGEPVGAAPEVAPLTAGAAEDPPALVADDPGRVPTAVQSVPAPGAAATHPAERKIVASHPAETRLADRRAAQPAETHVSDSKAAETRLPATGTPPRPMVVAAVSRPVAASSAVSPAASASAPAPTAAVPASVPAARGGSLLGMARGSALPPPRPMPVNATQWSNAN